uniref:SOCS box domain-containing protein n=1 Tax=Monopterus albus TaxID=43700 RepID=A0A3Q3KCZ9_MONAL
KNLMPKVLHKRTLEKKMMHFTECYPDTVSSVAAAVRSGSRKQLRRLIKRGRSVECRDNRGWSALHEAAAAGSTECVQELLSAVGSRAYVNSLTHEGESACHLAAQRGHLAVVQLLLEAHANIDQLTNDLSCPLYAAVDGGHKEVVELLVCEGAEVNRTHTASCWTCLHQATSDKLALLLLKGHSEIAVDDHRITPLFLAAQYGQQECLEILVNAGANVNTQAADLATPLLIASQEGHQACVDFLLDHGADPNKACSLDWPQLPIHAAAEFGHIGILRRLIAVTDRKCDRGDGMVSPLYMTVKNNHIKCVELLLKEGYSPDAQDCTHILGLSSPLSLRATLSEDNWMHAFITGERDMLPHILEHRWIPRQEVYTMGFSSPHNHGKIELTQFELRDLLCAVLSQAQFAASWLPLLMKAGLDRLCLINFCMFSRLEESKGDVLNYLLEFVNWSTLSSSLKHILDQRRAEKTWEPCPHNIPPLSHICRLQVRSVLGPDLVMRTNVVEQLPVPSPLHDFLKFRDIPEPPVQTRHHLDVDVV